MSVITKVLRIKNISTAAPMLVILAVLLALVGGCSSSSSLQHGGDKSPTDEGDGVGGEPAEIAKEWGYLTVSDGTRLRYVVERATADTVGPVIFQYDGYSAGTKPSLGTIAALKTRLLQKGYVFLGVSLRGTGCSSGTYDLFEPTWGTDGAEVVEWAAQQQWSDGNIGMGGYSFPGIMQLFTAIERPPHLKAIVPSAVIWDLYRDTAFPGGIFNVAFGALFTGQQQAPGLADLPQALLDGDFECAANQLVGRVTSEQIVLQGLTNPYVDSPVDYPARSAMTRAAEIDVPVLTINSWQDQQTGPRIGGVLEEGGLPSVFGSSNAWFVWANGLHGTLNKNEYYLDMMEDFYDHYLKGEQNGWGDTPKVTVLHELNKSSATPSWVAEYEALPTPEPRSYFLHSNGRLNTSPPGDVEDNVNWVYPTVSQQTLDSTVSDFEVMWGLLAGTNPLGSAVFTTEPLTENLELLGSASLDLWLSSTAPNTDLQVTLTELRPDGQEVYVQRGWLRASARKLDLQRSTATRPLHTFTEADKENLQAGANEVRIEIFPFSHVFREGSAMRVIIDSPVGSTGDWAFLVDPTPALNSLHISPEKPTRLVVGVMPVRESYPNALACGDIVGQPCRPAM